MHSKNSENPLGKSTNYISTYDPDLLFPIPRQDKREELGLKGNDLPFVGADIWNAYELSWLNFKGLPKVGYGEFQFSSDSTHIIESKSFKLYLNSLNQKRFESVNEFSSTIKNDLENKIGNSVAVKVYPVDAKKVKKIRQFDASCIDNQDIEVDQYDYNPNLLKTLSSAKSTSESLCSHLLKSNCLITNQPDWASVLIEYVGQPISHESLLRYLISFRNHNEFHEQCVERIYSDILKKCQPQKLTVYARYTRRGGLDINPWRSNCLETMANLRLIRQ